MNDENKIINKIREIFKTEREIAPPSPLDEEKNDGISGDLQTDIAAVNELFGNSCDLVVRRFSVDGVDFALLTAENMVDRKQLTADLCEPLTAMQNLPTSPDGVLRLIENTISASAEQRRTATLYETAELICAGWAAVFIEG